jgi:hypothetical protein
MGSTQLHHAYHTLDALCHYYKTVILSDLIQTGERHRPRSLSEIEHVAKYGCINSVTCIVHLKYVQSETPHLMGAYASTGPSAHCDTAVHPAAPDPPPHCHPYPEPASFPGPVTAPRPFLQEAMATSCLGHPCAPSRATTRGTRRRFRSCNTYQSKTHSEEKNWTYPACLARPAAELLLTPALQKKITSLFCGGFAKPNRSWNSSASRKSASGCELIGMLMAVGIVFASNSWGSRTSMRRRESEGVSRMARTYCC